MTPTHTRDDIPQVAPSARRAPSGAFCRSSALAGAVLLAALAEAPRAQAGEVFLPMPAQPDGKQLASDTITVGTTWLRLVDDAREELATEDDGDKRALVVQLWYPAVPSRANAKVKGRKRGAQRPASEGPVSQGFAPAGSLAPYMPQFRVLAPALGALYRAHGDKFETLRVPARVDARARKGKRMPLVVFSPGLGTIRLLYTAQILSLVSRGYIVAAVDHSYDADGVVFPGPELCERVDATASESENTPVPGKGLFAGPRLKVWAADLRFVADRVLALDKDKKSPLRGRIDKSKLALVGHCFGARAALLAAAEDARVGAVVLENPWPLAEESKSGDLAAKVLFAQGARIKEVVWLEKQGARQADIDKLRAQVMEQQLAFLRALGAPALRAEIEAQEHMDFTDIPMLGAWIAAGAKGAPLRSERRESVDGYIADYLDFALLGKKGVDVRAGRAGITVEAVEPGKGSKKD